MKLKNCKTLNSRDNQHYYYCVQCVVVQCNICYKYLIIQFEHVNSIWNNKAKRIQLKWHFNVKYLFKNRVSSPINWTLFRYQSRAPFGGQSYQQTSPQGRNSCVMYAQSDVHLPWKQEVTRLLVIFFFLRLLRASSLRSDKDSLDLISTGAVSEGKPKHTSISRTLPKY